MDNNYNKIWQERDTDEANACVKISRENIDVSVPIELQPDTCIGEIKAHCCEEPKVECRSDPCENKLDICIIQKIQLEIPVKFGIKTTVKESSIECSESSHAD